MPLAWPFLKSCVVWSHPRAYGSSQVQTCYLFLQMDVDKFGSQSNKMNNGGEKNDVCLLNQ